MNMVLPAAGRNLKENQDPFHQVLTLICTLKVDQDNIFLTKLKHFMILDLLDKNPDLDVETVLKLSQNSKLCQKLIN